MIISLIAAVAENKIIGNDNGLVWDLPFDTRYFKEVTSNHFVITGRKNYESIPERYRPLKNRTNVIVTRDPNYVAEGATVVHSIADALEIAKKAGENEVFIIGGGEIYQQTIELADRLYITEVKAEFTGDTLFPEYSTTDWKEISREKNLPDDKHEYAFDFVVLQRVKK